MKTKDHTGQLMRWSLILQEFTFDIQYESGKTHTDADCLSRNPLENTISIDDDSNVPTWPIYALKSSRQEKIINKHKDLILPVFDISEEQEKDPIIGNIIKQLNDQFISLHQRRKYKQYKIIDGKLYRRSKRHKNKYRVAQKG